VRSPAARGFSLNKTHQLILDRPVDLGGSIPVLRNSKFKMKNSKSCF
jgi:hypothetical protein